MKGNRKIPGPPPGCAGTIICYHNLMLAELGKCGRISVWQLYAWTILGPLRQKWVLKMAVPFVIGIEEYDMVRLS